MPWLSDGSELLKLVSLSSIHREAVYDDVAGPFEVDAVSGLAVSALDDGARVGLEGDRPLRGPALGKVPAKLKTVVSTLPYHDGVAGIDQARCPLDRPEGCPLRPRGRIAPVGRDVVRAAGRRRDLRPGNGQPARIQEHRKHDQRERCTKQTSRQRLRYPAHPHSYDVMPTSLRFEPVFRQTLPTRRAARSPSRVCGGTPRR